MDGINKDITFGSPFSIKVDEIDSAIRYCYIIIQKAKIAFKYLKEKNDYLAEKAIVWILRSLNCNDLNFQHLRREIGLIKEEEKINYELKRIAKDATRLIGEYKIFKKSKGFFINSKFRKDIERILTDIIRQELILEKAFDKLKNKLKKQVKKENDIYFVGINAGGTTTRYTIWDEGGKTVGYGEGDSGNVKNVKFFKALENILNAFKEASRSADLEYRRIHVARMAIGILIEIKEIHLRWGQLFRKYINTFCNNIRDVTCLPDTLVAWYAGLGGQPGILVIGGTGPHVYGYYNGKETNLDSYYNKERVREIIYVGGRRIAFFAAKIILKSIEKNTKSLMKEIVLDAFKRRQLFPKSDNVKVVLKDITDHYPNNAKTIEAEEVGHLAPLVLKAAENGDHDAIELISDASKNQSVLISEAAFELGLHNKPFKVTYSGNLISRPFVLHKIKKELKALEPNADVTEPVIGKEMDALKVIAMRNIKFY